MRGTGKAVEGEWKARKVQEDGRERFDLRNLRFRYPRSLDSARPGGVAGETEGIGRGEYGNCDPLNSTDK